MWKKQSRTKQATGGNTAHALCMLDTYGDTNTLGICNTYFFFHCYNGFAKAPQCRVIRALPVLIISAFISFDIST
jgi:hypothetical protein